jgi:hypothetical protein
MVDRHDVPANPSSSSRRVGKKIKSYLHKGSPSDKQQSDRRRNFIKGSLMAFLGSEISSVDSKGDPSKHAEPIPQHTASSHSELEEDPYPSVDATTEPRTKRTNIFHSMFKSPINHRQKKNVIQRRKMAEAQLEKDKKANARALPAVPSGLMVPDLDEPSTTLTSISDPKTHLAVHTEKHPTEKLVKSKPSAHTRPTKRRLHLKKTESQVGSTDRSTGHDSATPKTEKPKDGIVGNGDDGATLHSTFETLNNVEWGDLEFGVVGIGSVERLKMLQHRKASRRASFGGHPTYVSFDARPTTVVNIGSLHPKVNRRMSCGPLVSNPNNWGDTEHPEIPDHPSVNENAKRPPSLRKWASRRRDKSRSQKGTPIDTL